MSQKTKIEWTDGGSTWNPLRARVRKNAAQIAHEKGYTSLVKILTGVKSTAEAPPRVMPGETWGYHCEVSSPGCQRCYACTLNGRTLPSWGTGLPYDRRSRDLIEIYLDEAELVKPIHWKVPRKIFVCSMTDLFGEFVPDELINRIFAIMRATPWHTYQLLTKRASRVPLYIERLSGIRRGGWKSEEEMRKYIVIEDFNESNIFLYRCQWPLPNVQLGFSAEDQQRFDERWKAARQLDREGWFVWASLEPLLGPIDASSALGKLGSHLSWAVVGGESGPRARPMEVNWIRDLIRQFRAAGVPLFVKQLGSIPLVAACRQQHYDWGDEIGTIAKFSEWKPDHDKWRVHLADRKGGDPLQWASHLRVREFPKVDNAGR